MLLLMFFFNSWDSLFPNHYCYFWPVYGQYIVSTGFCWCFWTYTCICGVSEVTKVRQPALSTLGCQTFSMCFFFRMGASYWNPVTDFFGAESWLADCVVLPDISSNLKQQNYKVSHMVAKIQWFQTRCGIFLWINYVFCWPIPICYWLTSHRIMLGNRSHGCNHW